MKPTQTFWRLSLSRLIRFCRQSLVAPTLTATSGSKWFYSPRTTKPSTFNFQPATTPASANIGEHRRTSAGFGFLAFVSLSLLTFAAAAGPTPLVIHEWGTFTSLQDESGHAISGINTDDEPLPDFVHRFSNRLVFSTTDVPNSFFKGIPRCDTDVTMRLETPVLYFHPAPGATFPPVTVSVEFHGGWLTEYYPDAISTAPGFKGIFGPIHANTIGTLTWPNLTIRGNSAADSVANWSGPSTIDDVWTSPRAVQAADVRATNGEAERFLFYRGVAHLDSPISVTRNGDQLALHGYWTTTSYPVGISHLWLVDIASGGAVAFRVLPEVNLPSNGGTVATTPATFAPTDYSMANRETLRASLHDALVKNGLFSDEADALLNTWQVSYFKSSGLRLFFLVPKIWTDSNLPLQVSVPAPEHSRLGGRDQLADITRVMVGRIELVTPAQRELLRQIAQCPTNTIQSNAANVWQALLPLLRKSEAEVSPLYGGGKSLKDFGISVPPTYQSYLDLGRFRNALILQEAKDLPTPGLQAFIAAYGLHGFTPVDPSSNSVALFQ